METESIQSKLIREVIDKGICVSCGGCVGLCPYFSYFNGKVTVMDRCTLTTGNCIQVCPMANYNIGELKKSVLGIGEDPLGPYRDVLAARAKDPDIRNSGQYGGTVSALLILALEKGTIKSAILTDKGNGLSPAGKVAKSKSGILSCAGSRYSASGSLAILNREIKRGKKGIGVVGLPCQMEAIVRMGMIKTDETNINDCIALKMGIFCTWALDYRSLRRFLLEKGINKRPKRYDIPPPPAEVFQVETDNGLKEFPLIELRSLIQKGCLQCEDMTAEWADISVGSVEGRPGWNLVFVRNDIGSNLMEMATSEGILDVDEVKKKDLAHLIEAAENKKKKALESQKN